MGKKKKKGLNKRINPEKSNKMIYAVGIGVLILFIVGVSFVLKEDKESAGDPITKMVTKLNKSKNIINAKIDNNIDNTFNIILKDKNKDVLRLIKTEATEISYIKRKKEIEFIIYLSNLKNPIYSLKVKDGKIVNFKSIVKK